MVPGFGLPDIASLLPLAKAVLLETVNVYITAFGAFEAAPNHFFVFVQACIPLSIDAGKQRAFLRGASSEMLDGAVNPY